MTVIPTGIDVDRFAGGDGRGVRARFGIGEGDFVIGHVGRLAPEKNLRFLAEAVADYMRGNDKAHFIVAGQGLMREEMATIFAAAGVFGPRSHARQRPASGPARLLRGHECIRISSLSETQGLVLVEAMAAGIPVVALDAPGVREVVSDMQNGSLLPEEASIEEFSQSLAFVQESSDAQLAALKEHARETADGYSQSITSGLTAALYRAAIEAYKSKKPRDVGQLQATVEGLKEEWRILQNLAHAVKDAVLAPDVDIG